MNASLFGTTGSGAQNDGNFKKQISWQVPFWKLLEFFLSNGIPFFFFSAYLPVCRKHIAKLLRHPILPQWWCPKTHRWPTLLSPRSTPWRQDFLSHPSPQAQSFFTAALPSGFGNRFNKIFRDTPY